MDKINVKISDYLEEVCSRVRFKRARPAIFQEFSDHIQDQRAAYIKSGVDDDDAVVLALKEMGDPEDIGTAFDLTHRPKVQWSLIVLTVIVVLIGAAVQYFISSEATYVRIDRFKAHLICCMVGSGICAAVYCRGYETLIESGCKIFVILVTAFIVYNIINKDQLSYIGFEYFSGFNTHTIVNSLMLLFIPLYASVVYSFRSRGYAGIALSMLYSLYPLLLLAMTSASLTVGFMYTVCCLIILSTAICRGVFKINRLRAFLTLFMPLLLILGICLLILISTRPYIIAMISAYFDPEANINAYGYWIKAIQELSAGAKAVGDSGAMLDNINVNSLGQDFYINYAIAFLTAKAGYICAIVVTLIPVMLIVRCLYLSCQQKSNACFMISFACGITMCVQTATYLAFNFGFVIRAVYPLPFISYGGSAYIVDMVMLGLMLSVFSTGHLDRSEAAVNKSLKRKIITYENRKLIIDFNRK